MNFGERLPPPFRLQAEVHAPQHISRGPSWILGLLANAVRQQLLYQVNADVVAFLELVVCEPDDVSTIDESREKFLLSPGNSARIRVTREVLGYVHGLEIQTAFASKATARLTLSCKNDAEAGVDLVTLQPVDVKSQCTRRRVGFMRSKMGASYT